MPRRFPFLFPYAASCFLAVHLACGGGSRPSPVTPAMATRLVYTDPTSGTFRLVRNAGSTDQVLLLDLVGTRGDSGSGVAFAFVVKPTLATWTQGVTSGGTFNLGTGTPILKAKLVGNELQAAISQKGTASPVDLGSGVLARLQLNLVPGAPPGDGLLAANNAKCQVLTASGIQPITVAVGVLQGQ